MADEPISLQKLIDASTDADTYGDVVNGPADINGTGLVTSRTGGDKKTLAKLEAEFQAKIAEQEVQEQQATAEADRAEAARLIAEAAAASITPADILDIEAGVTIPRAPRFIGSANRLKRVGRCHWAKTIENEARVYYGNSGAIEKLLFDGAETIKGGDFFTAPAGSGDLQWATISGGTGATVSQVGAHSSPDIAGGTGKLVRFFGGSGANVECRFPNLTQSLVSGDVLQVNWLVSFDNPTTAFSALLFPRAASGGGSGGNMTYNVATDGTVTVNTATDLFVDLFDVDAMGRKWYRIARNYPSGGTGVYYPSIQLPAGQVLTVMAWTVKNPIQKIPTAVPVMANASFIHDDIKIGATQPIEVEWMNLRVGRTRVNDGTLRPPRDLATPAMPLENRIVVRAATEAAEVAYSLPGPRMGLLFPSAGNHAPRLGPGFWDIVPNILNANSYDIQSAYSDPKRWAVLRALRVAGTLLTSVNIDKVGFWLRTPIGAVTGTTADAQFAFQSELAPDRLTVGDVFVAGAQNDWSQYIVPPTANLPPEFIGRSTGRVVFQPAGSGIINIGRMKVVGAATAFTFNAASGQTVTVEAEGLASADMLGDHVNTGGAGTVNLNLGHWACGPFTPKPASFYQTQYEVEVDTGSGFVPLSSSGLTVNDLPVWHKMMRFGTHVGGVITPDPKPHNIFYVSSWAYTTGLGTSINKPGFQFRGPNVVFSDPETGEAIYRGPDLGNNTVWISDEVGVASPTDPRIRIRVTYVQWTSSSAFNVRTGALSAGAGTHGDFFQTIAGLPYSLNCQNVVWMGTGAQGFFAGPAASFNVRGFFGTDWITVLTVAGSATYVLEGLMVTPNNLDRDSSGQIYTPVPNISAGGTADLGGLYLSTTSRNPTGIGSNNGTLIAGPVPVATNRVVGNVSSPARTDQPGATNYLDFFIPAKHLTDGRVDATIDELSFTGYALEKMPYLNDVLNVVRVGAWGLFRELEEQCKLGPRTHTASIPNSTPVGTSLTLTPQDSTTHRAELTGTRIVEGDPRELFVIEGGVLKTAAPMRDAYGLALVDNPGLVTDAGERISVQVTA